MKKLLLCSILTLTVCLGWSEAEAQGLPTLTPFAAAWDTAAPRLKQGVLAVQKSARPELMRPKGQQQSEPLTRYPSIWNGVFSELKNWDDIATNNLYPKHLLYYEGQTSDPNSSWQAEEDYFAVYAENLPGHATVLVMDPIPADDNGVFSVPVHFRDVLNNVDYFIPNAADLKGSFVLGGETIYVEISYANGDPRYPQVELTWGDGATYGNVGDILDDFTYVVLDVEAPTGMTLSAVGTPNELGVIDGMYVGNSSQYGTNYVIQSSADMKAWTNESNQPLYIMGYTYVHWFQFGGDYKYFRALKQP